MTEGERFVGLFPRKTDFHDRNKRRSYELTRRVAARLIDDPRLVANGRDRTRWFPRRSGWGWRKPRRLESMVRRIQAGLDDADRQARSHPARGVGRDGPQHLPLGGFLDDHGFQGAPVLPSGEPPSEQSADALPLSLFERLRSEPCRVLLHEGGMLGVVGTPCQERVGQTLDLGSGDQAWPYPAFRKRPAEADQQRQDRECVGRPADSRLHGLHARIGVRKYLFLR